MAVIRLNFKMANDTISDFVGCKIWRYWTLRYQNFSGLH